jgi:hypothetical protein
VVSVLPIWKTKGWLGLLLKSSVSVPVNWAVESNL